jgi:hypothetical protein
VKSFCNLPSEKIKEIPERNNNVKNCLIKTPNQQVCSFAISNQYRSMIILVVVVVKISNQHHRLFNAHVSFSA